MTPEIVEPIETHEQVHVRAFASGMAAAAFDVAMGTDETPEAQAMRRKQDERNPWVWSEAFLKGYRSYQQGGLQ